MSRSLNITLRPMGHSIKRLRIPVRKPAGEPPHKNLVGYILSAQLLALLEATLLHHCLLQSDAPSAWEIWPSQ